MVFGLKIGVEHFPKQRLRLLQLVLLILHRYPGSVVVVEYLAPRIEQFDDPVLNTAKAFIPLCFIRKRLLTDAIEEGIEKPALKYRSHVRDQLNSLRRRELRYCVTGQSHECASKTTVERACRERRHAGHLNRAIKGPVVIPEPFVVRAVAR